MLAIPLGGVAALLLAVPTAFFAFRLQGAYFAIGTWVIAEVTRLLIAQWKALGGGTGTSLPREATSNILGVNADPRAVCCARGGSARHIGLLAGAGAGRGDDGVIYWLLRSRQGLALAAVRDNTTPRDRSASMPCGIKWAVFLIAAAMTGLTGALIYLQNGAHLARRSLLGHSTGRPM